MALQEFLKLYGEIGLLFSILVTAIIFLTREYVREKKSKEKVQDEFNKYLQDHQKKSTEASINTFFVLETIKERLTNIEYNTRNNGH